MEIKADSLIPGLARALRPHIGCSSHYFGVGSPNNNSIGKADPEIRARMEAHADPLTRHDDDWPRGKGYISLLHWQRHERDHRFGAATLGRK